MKIASSIKHRDGSTRVVTIHDQPYHFKPVHDKDEILHFVAEVKNEDHAAVLLGSGAFYRYGTDMQPQATLKPPVAPTTKAAKEDFKPDIDAEARALLVESVAKMGTKLGNVSSPAVIRAAIEIETASDTSRDSALKVLKLALEGVQAAGVKG